MADPDNPRIDGASPTQIHIEKKPRNWLAWIALALGLLALLFALSRCDGHDAGTNSPTAIDKSTEVVGSRSTAADSAVVGTSGLGSYLAGSEPAPRRFTFEKLNFDTASSKIRPADEAEVAAIATTLKQYPKSRIRIAGYADARGTDAANIKLGDARAANVKAALVAKGVDAGRIETGTGGEADPVDTNATKTGQAENRRTELVVTQR